MEKMNPQDRERIMKAIASICDTSKQSILFFVEAETKEVCFMSKGMCKKCIRDIITHTVEEAFAKEPRYEEDCQEHKKEEDGITSPFTWL